MTFTTMLKSASLAGAVCITTASMALAGPAPHSHGDNSGFGPVHGGPTSGQTPIMAPFVCNILSGGNADGFAGYINISSVRGLIYDFQTSDQQGTLADSSTGANAAFQSHPLTLKTISFDISNDSSESACFGPWVFVTAINKDGTTTNHAVNVQDGTESTAPETGFTRVTFTAADFGLTNKNSVGNIVFQLFPDPNNLQEVKMTNFQVNGTELRRNPRTLYNFCPLGFFDPRPNAGCTSGAP